MTKTPIPLASISDEEILARLAAVVGESLRIDPARVTRDTSLDALGAESIDIVEITLDVEHAFTVRMPEHTVLQLATEVAGDDVFEHRGALTARGAALLRARMPELADSALPPGTPVAALAPWFRRIDVWMRLVRTLLESTPRTCPACGERLVQGGPDRVRCPGCALELDVPSGDEIGRAWIRDWIAAHPA